MPCLEPTTFMWFFIVNVSNELNVFQLKIQLNESVSYLRPGESLDNKKLQPYHLQYLSVLCIFISTVLYSNENESVFTDQFSRDPIPGHVSAGCSQWCGVSSGQGGALCWVVVCPPAVLTKQPHYSYCHCVVLTLDSALLLLLVVNVVCELKLCSVTPFMSDPNIYL